VTTPATCLVLLISLGLSGCVKRAILIQSDPPGAAVKINGQDAGVTPIEHEFITHGRYRFTLSKPGFQEVTAREWVKAPWHQWIPLDFVTELLLPIRFDDRHAFHYRLQPLKPAERMAIEPRPDVHELIIQLRGSSDPQRRREACVLMARHHVIEGVPALEEAVHDPNPDVRAAALQALRVLAGREAMPNLVRALEADPDAVVRWQAAVELEALRAPEALPALQAGLRDRDPLVRASAVEALRGVGDPSAVPAVSTRLRDAAIVVRRSAADALGALGDPTAASALGRALRDPDPDVRRLAARSLLTLKTPEASEALARALRDRDPRVRATVIEALRQFGTPQAVPIALRYVRAWQSSTREAAAAALGGLKDPRAVPVLQRAVHRESNPYTRLSMAKALVELGAWSPAVVEPYRLRVVEEDERRKARERLESSAQRR